MAALSTLSEGSGLDKTAQLYLKLTAQCMKEVDILISVRGSTSLKFNHMQCQYLADKLKMAVRSAESFLELNKALSSSFASHEDMIQPPEVFKLLLSLGKEVESFIQGCCKDNWIQCAILLANALEYTSSLCVNLELCTKVFLGEEEFSTLPRMTFDQFSYTSLTSTAIAKVVKEKADLDEMMLIEDVNAVILSSRTSTAEWELASVLLGRFNFLSNQSSHSVILLKNLEQLEMLGTGTFGTVHKARCFEVQVAKKAFHGLGFEGREHPSFSQEVSILDGLHHPNIVSLLWYGTHLRKCYIVMELMDGDLQALMQKRMEDGGISGSPFTISEALDMMLQVGEGMLFLHEQNIVHRDLKSHNILVKCVEVREVNGMFLRVKVADFGMSKTKEKSMTYSNQTQNQGTTRWMAPESFQNQKLKYPFKCDIYSFGMVCYEILTGHLPFPNLEPAEVKMKVKAGERPKIPNYCPPRLRKLIKACWSPDPSSRPHFGDICGEIRQMKREYLMECWSQMHGENEREAEGGSGRRKGLQKIRGLNMGDVVNYNDCTHHTFAGSMKWPFAELLTREVVMALKRENVLSLIVAVALPLLAGVCVSMFHGPSQWFMDLRKLSWISRPVFGLIWIMYPIMGLASWLVWVDGGFGRDGLALIGPVLQFGLILLWSLHFFADHNIGLAFADILGVDLFVLTCIGAFPRVSPRSCAGSLMSIYFYWTFFASFLTLYIFVRNRGHSGERSAMLP